MHPELIAAVKERTELGYTNEAIRDELRAAGHSDEVIDEVLKVVGREVAIATESAEATLLPSLTTLLNGGWAFVKQRLDLVTALALPLMLLVVFEYLLRTQISEQQVGLLLGVAMASLVVGLTYLLFLGTALRVATTENAHTSLQEGFTWARGHVGSLLWIYILTTLVVGGGMLLLIIPGIIISFYIYFSQYVLAIEGVKGMSALSRSYELVKDRWWAVAGRLVQITLVIFLVAFLFGVVSEIIAGLAFSEVTAELVINILGQILSAVMTVFGLHIGTQIYRALVVDCPFVTAPQKKNWKYIIFAFLGVIFFLIISATTVYIVNSETVEPSTETVIDGDTKARAAELREINGEERGETTEENNPANIEY